jgi:DNA repair photolyase
MLYKTQVPGLDYAMNPVQGCSHGCRYPCYAYLMAMRFGKVHSYAEWLEPVIVENTLELLEKELKKWRYRIRSVHFCFSTDPFMFQHPEVQALCLDSIRMINAAGIPCIVLTKGILPVELAKLDERNRYGISLVSLDEEFRRRWEPGASPYQDRIAALQELHEKGKRTWVHMEPYPTPNLAAQNIDEILEAVKFTDQLDFGGLNYNSIIQQFPDAGSFYQAMRNRVAAFCADNGINS